jgi:arylsulfatase A
MKRLLALCSLLLGLSANAQISKPNILLLYADDMGYGDLAIQNAKSKIPTPCLDQLVREGMRFTDGHSS